MSNPEVELVNEFEYQYYGFSPIGFTDSIYNIAVQSWEDAVKEVSSACLPQVCNEKKYLNQVIRMFFLRNKVRRAFSTFTERTQKYILRIPRHVTLPEHKDTFELMHSKDPNLKLTDDLYRECERLEAELVENRFILAELSDQLQQAKDVIEVLNALIDELQRDSSDVEADSEDDTDATGTFVD